MSFLSPWFLLASAAVAVPVFLHLFQRRKTVRLTFPALRYLERTEREHAREIRLRQLLLLLTRVVVLLLLVLAGARPLLPGPGTAHAPTAVVVILDNSMSSGAVVGDERVLDGLKRVVEASLDRAGPDDRFWVIRAGAPWTPAAAGTAEDARAVVRATDVSAARGDLTGALERAEGLLATSPLGAREIHLVSDLQATGFDLDRPSPAPDTPVLVWAAERPVVDNRGLVELTLGGGLTPVEGQSAELAVRLSGSPEDGDAVGIRAVQEGRIRAAASAPPGTVATLVLPASGPGWVTGSVEADPDALSLDDRRFFAFRSRPPPVVHVVGEPGRFAREALSVLEASSRLRASGSNEPADLRISVGGAGLEAGAEAFLVVPPSDATLLPALNVRLEAAGVPWRYSAGVASGTAGSAALSGASLPPGLERVDVHRRYALERSAPAAVEDRLLAEISGEAWAVHTGSADGIPVLLLASSLEPEASSLPVSAGLVRFLDWVAGGWAGAGSIAGEHVAGRPLPAPVGATRVVVPTGDTVAVDGSRPLMATGAVGHYRFLTADSVLSWIAVNPPAAESDLRPLDTGDLQRAVGAAVTVATNEGQWTDSIYFERTGPEIWWPLLFLALLVLVVEARLAAAGTQPSKTNTPTDTAPAHGAT